MAARRRARSAKPRASKPREPRATLTLADVTVEWAAPGPDARRIASGYQLAQLMVQNLEQFPSGSFEAAERQVHLLRGLADLVYPDARAADNLPENTRAFVCDFMEHAAAVIAAETCVTPTTLGQFRVRIRPGSGLPKPVRASKVTP